MALSVLTCNECDVQESYLPPKYVCPHCYSESFTEQQLDGEGTIYSYTEIHVPPEDFMDEAPYYIILVDLDERIRITARLISGVPTIGKKVKLKEINDKIYWFELS